VPQNDDQLDPNRPNFAQFLFELLALNGTKWKLSEIRPVGVKLIVILRHIIAYFSSNIR
jgi:hypothetical protein